MNKPRLRLRQLFPLTVTIVAVVALAACSSDSKTSTSSQSTTSSTAAASTTAVVIKTATNGTLGKILVDAGSGKTVYTLTKGGAAVSCTGACLGVWPPVLLPAGTADATGSAGVKDLGVAAGGGGQQVTSTGLPLYTFSGDAAAGDANGEGINGFGGTWHVVKVSGGTAGVAKTTTTTSSSSGY